jgi:putative membrane protein
VVRLIVRTLIGLVANGIGLIVAASLLDGMELNTSGFVVAVVIFTIVYALAQPFLIMQFRASAPAMLGGVALVATLAALIVTDLVSDGLTISGVGTWIAATVIVWVVSVLATIVLPFLGLKKYLEERRS